MNDAIKCIYANILKYQWKIDLVSYNENRVIVILKNPDKSVNIMAVLHPDSSKNYTYPYNGSWRKVEIEL